MNVLFPRGIGMILMVITCTLASICAQSQEEEILSEQIQLSPKALKRYIDESAVKSENLDDKLNSKANKALRDQQKLEEKIQKKLRRIDSTKANEVYASLQEKYTSLEQRLKQVDRGGSYIPPLDTLTSSLKFLNQDLPLLSKAKQTKEKLGQTLENVNGLKQQFNRAEDIKTFIKERRQYLKDQCYDTYARNPNCCQKRIFIYLHK